MLMSPLVSCLPTFILIPPTKIIYEPCHTDSRYKYFMNRGGYYIHTFPNSYQIKCIRLELGTTLIRDNVPKIQYFLLMSSHSLLSISFKTKFYIAIDTANVSPLTDNISFIHTRAYWKVFSVKMCPSSV